MIRSDKKNNILMSVAIAVYKMLFTAILGIVLITWGVIFGMTIFGGDGIQTFNEIRNNDLLQANKWTIQKDYDFKDPNARKTLVNYVNFDRTDNNWGKLYNVENHELLS